MGVLYGARFAAPALLALLLVLLAACGADATSTPLPVSTPNAATPTNAPSPTRETEQQSVDTVSVSLNNMGDDTEGHTPRGFRGMGTGLFVGDNLNPNFPDGDGVQIFLTFDLGSVPTGRVISAELRSANVNIVGTLFEDLGLLRAEEVRYGEFSPELFMLEPMTGGATCVFATSPNGPYRCDLASAVQQSLDDSYPLAQFRLRLEKAGDGDGKPDLVSFFKTNSDTNEPGIFQLEISVDPS